VGLADRDYMRQPPPRESSSGARILALAAAVGLLAAGAHWLLAHHRGQSRGIVVYPVALPGVPGITLRDTQSPYSRHDPWSPWLAPDSVCPGGDDDTLSARVQAVTALCLLNYARERQDLTPLAESPLLDAAAGQKARDIVACNDFSHFACGKQPDANARTLGLTDSAFGENIYWGPEMFQPPRVAVDQWLNSEHHRENLFNPRWKYQGVAVLSAPGFRDASAGEVWVEEFSGP